jgi:DNA-binding ferritin-like protein
MGLTSPPRSSSATASGVPDAALERLPRAEQRSPGSRTDRAEEARVQANEMRDPAAGRMLLAIAENYDQLAEQVEARIRSGAPPPDRAAQVNNIDEIDSTIHSTYRAPRR